MTIAFTGGSSGGHFYPIIAVAEAIQDMVRNKRLLGPKLYYLAPKPFDQKALFDNGIAYINIPAGKMRRYFSVQNITDLLVTAVGIVRALFVLFRLYPDVVMSKGGYGSVPVVIAARILRIPVVLHESDAKPGRANLLAARLGADIAISFDSAADYFPKNAHTRIARTGIPVRKALMHVEPEGARQYLGLDTTVPTVLILGGSQGSQKINEAVLSGLPSLVMFTNVIHQTGPAHLTSVEQVAKIALEKDAHASRYHPFSYLSATSLQQAAGAADIIVSRAGAGSISEIALWKKPAILIPIPESVSHDQRTNAYAYARTGGAIVIEEQNLTPHLLASEITRVLSDSALAARMSASASGFTDPDAARILATKLLGTALLHETA